MVKCLVPLECFSASTASDLVLLTSLCAVLFTQFPRGSPVRFFLAWPEMLYSCFSKFDDCLRYIKMPCIKAMYVQNCG